MTGHHASLAPIDKIAPAPLPPHIVARPRLVGYLAEAPQRRVTALTAGAGFGKTTAMSTWAQNAHCAWYTVTPDDEDPLVLARGLVSSLTLRAPGLLDALRPALDGAHGPNARDTDVVDALVPALAAGLRAGLASDVVLVLDDLHELDSASTGMRLVANLCHMAPRRLHLLVALRGDLPFPVSRLRLHGQLQVLTAESLRFDEDEIAALLASVSGPDQDTDARAVARLTGGWPAAVRLVAERLATTAEPVRVLDDLQGRGGAAELVDDLLGAEAATASAELLALLRVGAALIAFDADLLDALGVRDSAAVLGSARRRGIHIAPAPREGWHSLTPMSREYALSRLTTPDEVELVRVGAAQWHLDRGEAATAMRYLSLTTDRQATATVLERHGADLLAAGHGGLVADALNGIGPEHRTPAIDLVEGEMCEVRGDWDRAVECLSRLVPALGPAPAHAAWRLGLIHHMRGEPENALALYRRGLADAAGTSRDRALAAAWGSAAAWLMGDENASHDLVAAAEALTTPDDDQVLAATHTARAMLAALTGDRRANDRHYLRALEHAERAGDVLQVIRIRTNRGSRFVEEGYYAEALAELDAAIALAELAGYATLHALALSNRGEAARRLGRLDDATRDLQAALGIQQRVGSRMASYALTCLGAVHLDQGNTMLARASYEEALGLAQPSGDLQGLVPALAGLARAVAPEQPDLAEKLLTQAFATATNLAHTATLLAAGWVALGRGDVEAVRRHSVAASDAARTRRDRAGVAEALELLAAVESDQDRRRGQLVEAEAMWRALGCPLALARTQLAQITAGLVEHTAAAEVERTCYELGARTLAEHAATLRVHHAGGPAQELAIRTLGGFRVLRDGTAIGAAVWQSRKARDLLKILVSRRGASLSRDVACELLWPGVPVDRASNRLSVAISTVRLVLDPEHRHSSDRYLASGDGVVRLRLDHIDVDLEAFLNAATTALHSGDPAALAAAEVAYTGDFCAEDRYADWAEPVREEARSVFVSVARALAQHHGGAGEHEHAIRHLHRLLACEPYDEPAHLLVVRELDVSGRHGDARRMYRAYVARMAELDLQPAPYPG